LNISCFGLGGSPSARATLGIAKAAAVAASTSRLVLMARSAKNSGTKFDADRLAMQCITARADRGARAMGAAEKSRQSAQSPDASLEDV
jgi:hypothetical protein